MKKICVITGGTSGIGKATARYISEKNYKVYEISRHAPQSNECEHVTADVTDAVAVKHAVDLIVSREGRIDLLVNSAGFGISGAAEFTDIKDAKSQFDVNFFGIFNMCKAVIPVMRGKGAGRIINIGSVAGVVPIPFQSFYSASKAAILSFSMSLANELRPFGITVICIQPGDIKTGFTSARVKTAAGDDVYDGRISRSVSKMEYDEQTGMPPEAAGKFIAKAAIGSSKRPVRTIGFSYKVVCFLAKILPLGLMNKIIGKLYAD